MRNDKDIRIRNPFDGVEWIAWIGATLAACVSLTAFAYKEFQTRDAAMEMKADIVERLQRIENKLDAQSAERR